MNSWKSVAPTLLLCLQSRIRWWKVHGWRQDLKSLNRTDNLAHSGGLNITSKKSSWICKAMEQALRDDAIDPMPRSGDRSRAALSVSFFTSWNSSLLSSIPEIKLFKMEWVPYSWAAIVFNPHNSHLSSFGGSCNNCEPLLSIAPLSQSTSIISSSFSGCMYRSHSECVPSMNGTGASINDSKCSGTTGR